MTWIFAKEHPDRVGEPKTPPKIDGKMLLFPELYIVCLSLCSTSTLSFFIPCNKMHLHRHQLPDLVGGLRSHLVSYLFNNSLPQLLLNHSSQLVPLL